MVLCDALGCFVKPHQHGCHYSMYREPLQTSTAVYTTAAETTRPAECPGGFLQKRHHWGSQVPADEEEGGRGAPVMVSLPWAATPPTAPSPLSAMASCMCAPCPLASVTSNDAPSRIVQRYGANCSHADYAHALALSF